MKNPFDSGEIKNYILFYVGVVVIMVLFFVAASLFHEIMPQERKIFDVNVSKAVSLGATQKDIQEANTTQPSHTFRLLEKAY